MDLSKYYTESVSDVFRFALVLKFRIEDIKRPDLDYIPPTIVFYIYSLIVTLL